MAKIGHQQAPTPVSGSDVATKEFIENLNRQTASGDYLVATLSVAQNNVVAAGTPIAFDRVDASRGSGITLDVTTNIGRLALKAGRTYLLSCRIYFGTGGGAARLHQVWNVTDNQAVPGTDTAIWNAAAASTAGGPQSLTVPLAPLVDTEYEIRLQSALDTDYSADWTGITVTEIGATVISTTGGLEFMDIIEVTADTTSVSFGAAGDGLTGRALDGDVDGTYILEYYFPDPGGATSFEFQPNGLTTDQEGARHFAGSSTASSAETRLYLWKSTSAGFVAGGSAEFHAKSGKERTWLANGSLTGATDFIDSYAGHWTDFSTNVTSLDITSTLASAIRTGARFVLYRRITTPVRADSADTYERKVEAAVVQGSATEEYTTGHTAFGGSTIGLTVRLEDAVTAGTIVVNLKVDGVTKLSTTLDTTNSTSNRAVAPIGVFPHGADKNVSVEVIATGYVNAGVVTSGLTIVGVLLNDALIQPPSLSYMPGHLDGLKMTFNTVSTVAIAAGNARDSTNTANIDVLSLLTADITVSGVNGLDTGSEANDTWYALYVIGDTSGTNLAASLLSVSFTSPTMPAGYDVFRRVGAVRNRGADIEDFSQRGNGRSRIVFPSNTVANPIVSGGVATTTTTASAAGRIPPSSTLGYVRIQFQPGAVTHLADVREAGSSDIAVRFRPGVLTPGTDQVHGPFICATNASQEYEYRLDGGVVTITVPAYVDDL